MYVSFCPTNPALLASASLHNIYLSEVPSGACRATLTGHTSSLNSVAFSPDGRTLVSASSNFTVNYFPGCAIDNTDTVRLWDVDTGACTSTLSGTPVLCAAFSPDGRRIASTSDDGIVKMWDAASGTCTSSFQGNKHGFFIQRIRKRTHGGVAFSPDGRSLLLASGAHEAEVWDTATGRRRLALAGHSSGVYSAAYSPDGCTIATASMDRSVKLWDAVSGACKDTLADKMTMNGARFVAFSPDGRHLACALTDDFPVSVWGLTSRKCITRLRKHADEVTCIAFSPNAGTLATASLDNTVKLWR